MANLSNVQSVINSANPTDAQIRAAFTDLLSALTQGGGLEPFLRLNSAGAPTDAIVQQAAVEAGAGREVFDGQVVAVRAAGKFQLYIRDAGAWIAVDDA